MKENQWTLIPKHQHCIKIWKSRVKSEHLHTVLISKKKIKMNLLNSNHILMGIQERWIHKLNLRKYLKIENKRKQEIDFWEVIMAEYQHKNHLKGKSSKNLFSTHLLENLLTVNLEPTTIMKMVINMLWVRSIQNLEISSTYPIWTSTNSKQTA